MLKALFAAAIVLLSAGCSSDDSGNDQKKLQHWNGLLANELKPGSSLATAEQFFSRHGLGSDYSTSDHILFSIDRNVRADDHSVVSPSITFQCPFDTRDRLILCKAELAYTGP
jgi:hypothetical protein